MSTLSAAERPKWIWARDAKAWSSQLHRRDEAIAAAIERWAGTPYCQGQASPGVGADCVGFLCGVLGTLYGVHLSDHPRKAADAACHDARASIELERWICDRLPVRYAIGAFVEPGDVLLARPWQAGGWGHVYVVGPRPQTLWHCVQGHGVTRTSTAAVQGVRAYWMGGKTTWW